MRANFLARSWFSRSIWRRRAKVRMISMLTCTTCTPSLAGRNHLGKDNPFAEHRTRRERRPCRVHSQAIVLWLIGLPMLACRDVRPGLGRVSRPSA
jgi:hypothetical protein